MRRMSKYDHSRAAFTLIELLVVIAIVAVLSVVVVLTLNPAEILKQGRDSNRLADMNTLNSALSVFLADQPGGSLGSASTTYISIPDADSSCGSLGLPAAPSGWSYYCAPSSTFRNVDGTGWLPVDFAAASAGSPLGQLPIDPINATSSGYYYTYTPGGSYELTTLLESQKHASKMAEDSGLDPLMYESGTNLALSGFVHGLAAYFRFGDGSGTSAADSSGSGATATLIGGPTWTSGKFGGGLSMDGSNDYLQLGEIAGIKGISMWVNISTSQGGDWRYLMDARTGLANGYFANQGIGSDWTNLYVNGSSASVTWDAIPKGSWVHLYLVPSASFTDDLALMARYTGSDSLASYLDDVRIYTRSLSANEIQKIYEAAN